MAAHSNIGVGKHGYIGLAASPNTYALLTNTPCVCQVHPGNTPKPKLNGPILTVFQTLKNVVASEVEAEIGGMFVNGQKMAPIRNTLITMDHP